MNKKLFIGATALTAVAVAGYIRYRHVALEQLDSWLHPRVQDPEQDTSISGRVLHDRHPDMYDERGRPIRKEDTTTG